ncbi:MAG: hypothetical protein JXA20_14945 [Spirochaetes bacterium]|nr:hypothetical protein [Spirochaetota bacterium]
MKRIAILAAAAAITAVLARPAGAVNISAGPVLWFAWWDPAFEDSLSMENANYPSVKTYRMDPDFMYGPSISIGAGNWNVSAVFIMGGYHASLRGIGYMSPQFSPLYNSQDIDKYDLDVTASYTIHPVVKVFWGFKYQRYAWATQTSLFTLLSFDDMLMNNYGTGPGVSLNLNLAGSLYLLLNVSALYMANYTERETLMFGPPSTFIPIQSEAVVHSFGGNAVLSLAYYIDPINTTLALGFRYQYIRFLKAGGDIDDLLSNERDQFYGIFVSATYTFEL